MSVKLYSNVTVLTDTDPAPAHDIAAALHTHTGGAALDILGLSAASTVAMLTPLASPGAAAAILRTTDAGLLTLLNLVISQHLLLGGGLYVGNSAGTTADGCVYLERGKTGASDAATDRPQFVFRRTRGTVAAKTNVVSGDWLGSYEFRGNYSNYYYLAANVYAVADGTWDASNKPGRLVFATMPNGGSAALDRMEIKQDGATRIGRSLVVGNLLSSPADNELWTDGDIRCATGLVAGSTATDPAAGEVLATTRLKAGSVADSTDGTTSLRTYTAAGSSIVWTYAGLDGTARTVIPDGAGDVTALLAVEAVIKPSTGTTTYDAARLAPGAAARTIYDDGTNRCAITVNADGSVQVQRTAGTVTFTIIINATWI